MILRKSSLTQAVIVFAVLIAIDIEVGATGGGWPPCPTATCNGKKPDTNLVPCNGTVPWTPCSNIAEAGCPLPGMASCSGVTGETRTQRIEDCTGPNFCANNHCQNGTVPLACAGFYSCEWDPGLNRCTFVEFCSSNVNTSYKINTYCGL